jgi:4-alpha-glucanotransferase
LKRREKSALDKLKVEEKDNIEYYKREQFIAFSQWYALKKYANDKNIEIIGDMPIYSSYDSHDVWANPENYLLDTDLKPKMVAGVPPDAFTEDGQLWGNPLYNWEKVSEDNFSWWRKKFTHQSKLYDVVRVDHFRGFEAFFAIPYGKSAKNGKWIKAPGEKLFEIIKKEVSVDIIAEDLGLITPAVRKLLKNCGFPNMRVLQFGFDGDLTHEYLPHNYPENCVAYTGTHDNAPSTAWFLEQEDRKKEMIEDYAESKVQPVFGLIKKLMASKADRVIIPMQDYLLQSAEDRMNFPGKEMGNWVYRIEEKVLCDKPFIRAIRDLSERDLSK